MTVARGGELTAADPFGRRLAAYLGERFPVFRHGVLIAAYTSSNAFLAQAVTAPGRPVAYGWTTLAAAVTLFLFFFHLRVFDEHKDYAEDCRHHPARVLQRGLVTLGQLARLGAVAIAIQLLVAALMGPAALAALALALGFSLLMRVEFFAGEWLRRHFLVYAASHLLVMPLLSLTVFSFTTGRFPWQAPPTFLLYSAVGFFVTFNWEVSRKIRAPEDEIEGVASYTRIFGTRGAAHLVVAIRVVDTALVSLVGWRLGLPAGFYLALVALFGVCLVGYGQYLARPDRARARRMELWAGVYVVAFDLILAASLAARLGVEVHG